MQFGRHLRDEWLLDPAITYLNHGTEIGRAHV